MKTLALLALVLLSGCAATTSTPETFGQCEIHTRHLFGNVNGCWRVTSRQGYQDGNTYMCEAEPTCEVIPGTDQDYVSGDVAWVGDVECSNTCKANE
jgi:hypothetical protein